MYPEVDCGSAATTPDMMHCTQFSSRSREARTGHELLASAAVVRRRNKLRDSLSLKESQPTSDAGHGPLSSARFVL